MRIDHIAYRTADREKTAQFFIDAFGYKVQTTFEPVFSDGTTQGVKCIALEPPEKITDKMPWTRNALLAVMSEDSPASTKWGNYHLAPEVFISDGPPESVVGKWVAKRGGVGGIHHIAYQVEDVEAVMHEWREKGYAEFLSDKPLTCPGLEQVFTRPSELTGVIYEFITRTGPGFCAENVGGLMESTTECS